jgi:hypothetical protein
VSSGLTTGTGGVLRKSSGSGLHLLSVTSIVTRQVKVCCCRDRFRVGNSDRTLTLGGGIGFLVWLDLGLTRFVSIDCTS